MTSVGMNLSAVNFWGSEEPFVDRFKTSGNWYAVDNYYKRIDAPIPFDSKGYPSGMPVGAKELSVQIGLDPLSAIGIDTYVMTYAGTASFRMTGGTIIGSKSGEIIFKLTDPANNFVTLTATSISATSPLTDIHVVRQDQVDLFKAGTIFNPDFLAKASQWDTLRFMDWGATNFSKTVTWDSRTTVQSASWSQSSATGVPLEIMVALANQTKAGMWFNIPTTSDDTYVKKAMEFIRDNLNPSIKVHVEYSNEVWNWSFAASHYAQTKANALWGKDANGDGKIDANDPKEYVAGGQEVYYGYRSAQIAAIANTVFAQTPDRLATIIGTQTAYTGLETKIFDGIALANVGTPDKLFDEYAVTTYFGNALSATSSATDQATVLGWARGGAAGMAAAFKELEFGGTLSTNDSLAALMNTLIYQEGVAQKYGLDLVAYEGGAHLTASSFPSAVQAEVSTFIGKLMNDPRMGDLYTKMVNLFSAVGGVELTAFSDAAGGGVGGYWGVLDDIYQTGSARYDALLAAAKVGRNAPAPAPATTITGTAVTTKLASYTLSDDLLNLTYSGSNMFTGMGNALNNTITAGNHGSKLLGYAGNDTLVGGAGADMLDGGTGADIMKGGAGDDVYYVDNVGDTVTELPGQGNDTIHTTLTAYTLGANVENLISDGIGNFTGFGNDLNNVLTGGAGNNKLYGGAGNDTLIGGAVADVLDGGTGADIMKGGAGDDVYYVDNVGDMVTELPGQGNDTVHTTLATYRLGANVENLVADGLGIFNGFGNELDNVLTGGSGNNNLDGGAGNDTLIGGAGNDSLFGGIGADIMRGGLGNDNYFVDNVGDVVTELPGQGTDTVNASINYTLVANVEKLFLSGPASVGTGNSLDNWIQNQNTSGSGTLYGLDGNDVLIGGSGADTLYGGNGNDLLRGGAGNDVLVGGAGMDDLEGGTGADRFVFRVGDTGATRATADSIRDFSHSDGDKIDLSSFKLPNGQALHFVGLTNFGKTAGEVRISAVGDIQVDLNGDGITDLYIGITSQGGRLIASDFIF